MWLRRPEASLLVTSLLHRLRLDGAARSRRLWAVAVALTVAGFCGASALMLCDMRRDARDRAVTAEVNLLSALSQDIARNIELYDLSLRAVADALAEPGFADLPPRVQDLMLYDRAATASDLGAVLVLGRDGRVARASRPGFVGADLSGAEYVRALRADPGQDLHIGRSVRGPGTGDEGAIVLARALRAPDGTFAGAVAGTLHLAYLRDLFAKADLGPHGAVNLFLLDGTRLVRVPRGPSSADRSLAGTANFARLSSTPSGTFDASSAVDGVRRIYSFTRVGRLPLVLDVAMAEEDVLAPWRTRAAVIGAALLVLSVTAALLSHLRARGEAEHRLLTENAIDVVIRLDGALRRTYVSASSRAVLGYAPSELLGGSPRDTVLAEDWPIAAAWLDSARAGQGGGEAVFRVRSKGGDVLWVEGRCRVLPGGAGLMTVLRDVSGRRAAEAHAAALKDELARLANSDGLTGLANRRRFDAVLADEWARAAGNGRPLSLLLLDVDRFKAFNDRYGHQQGDACLRAVAGSVVGAVTCGRATVARYGGEEIAVVLPGTDGAEAADQADRVRAAVQELALAHADNRGGVVTVSVGCATAHGGTGLASDGALVALADARLYEAKRFGRNRVVAAQPAATLVQQLAREEARLAAVSRCEAPGALASCPAFDRIADLAAHLFGTPGAFVSAVREDEVVLVGRHGTDLVAEPRGEVFCAQTVLGEGALVVLDAAADPRFAGLPMVRAGCRFYAGAPFKDPVSGDNLGALCIVAEAPRSGFDASQREVLTGLADLVTEELRRRLPAEAGAGRGQEGRAA